MEKINIAELLKDCPKGMELDCSVFEDVALYRIDIDTENEYPIRIKTKNDYFLDLTKYGTYSNIEEAKYVIFPKGKTTWEGFVPPCKFKDGDVISVIINKNRWYGIYQKEFNTILYSYADYSDLTKKLYPSNGNGLCQIDDIVEMRLATEEEKQKLFDAIKANGYKWNAETKTLEKLPKFKVGDRVKYKNTNICKCIRRYDDILNYYATSDDYIITLEKQDDWELVPNKFDVRTLKPFDKVLVRPHHMAEWKVDFFSHYTEGADFPYNTVGNSYHCYCIPFKGNEYLCGTTDECNNFYKTWEE